MYGCGMTDLSEYTTSDPLILLVKKLFSDVETVGFAQGARVSDELAANAVTSVLLFTEALINLQNFETELTWDEQYDTSLAFVQSNRTRLEAKFEFALTSVEDSLVELRPEWSAKELAEYLQPLHDEYELLKRMIGRLTQGHLALQGHFECFIGCGPTFEWAAEPETMKFFEPLYELRDEYFLAPRPDLLCEYMAMAEAMEKTRFYNERSPKAVGNKIMHERLHVEVVKHAASLEILSLLDTMLINDERVKL